MREEEVSDKGERSTVILEARFDGRDYPVAGSPFADAVSYKRIDLHNIKGAIKKAGKVVLNEAVVISADGRTMTSTYSQGSSPTGFAVFEKQ